jgi:predicted cupin superfamily sugar epimerase
MVGPGFDFADFEMLADLPADAGRARAAGGDVAALV